MKKKIITIFISTFLIIILCEIILANYVKKRIYEFDPLLGWKVKKNLTAKKYSSGKKYEIFTNKFRFRSNKEKNILHDPCDFNYIFLGDSFVFGAGVDIENRFDVLLNKEKAVNSINFGVPAFSILQSYLKQKQYINQFNCKISKKLILIVYENDLVDAQLTHVAYRTRPLLINGKILNLKRE